MSGVDSIQNFGSSPLTGAVIVNGVGSITSGQSGQTINFALGSIPAVTSLNGESGAQTIALNNGMGSITTDGLGGIQFFPYAPATGTATSATLVSQNLPTLAWSAGSYVPGAVVIGSDNNTYVCVAPSTSAPPSAGEWVAIGGGGGGGSGNVVATTSTTEPTALEWSSGVYNPGDIVYDASSTPPNQVYVCSATTTVGNSAPHLNTPALWNLLVSQSGGGGSGSSISNAGTSLSIGTNGSITASFTDTASQSNQFVVETVVPTTTPPTGAGSVVIQANGDLGTFSQGSINNGLTVSSLIHKLTSTAGSVELGMADTGYIGVNPTGYASEGKVPYYLEAEWFNTTAYAIGSIVCLGTPANPTSFWYCYLNVPGFVSNPPPNLDPDHWYPFSIPTAPAPIDPYLLSFAQDCDLFAYLSNQNPFYNVAGTVPLTNVLLINNYSYDNGGTTALYPTLVANVSYTLNIEFTFNDIKPTSLNTIVSGGTVEFGIIIGAPASSLYSVIEEADLPPGTLTFPLWTNTVATATPNGTETVLARVLSTVFSFPETTNGTFGFYYKNINGVSNPINDPVQIIFRLATPPLGTSAILTSAGQLSGVLPI